MEFFVYGRDRPSVDALRDETTEAHWSFMDRYADALIARGPTLTDDGELATGSVHIVDLPDRAAAEVFAFDEPYFKAGVFAEVLVCRWRNRLGRTMWQFPRELGGEQRFVIIGHAEGGTEPHLADDGRLIVAGPLLSDDGTRWLGTVILTQQPDRVAADSLVLGEPYQRVEVHRWEFGGRR
jgi:uncharacterized protein YciI